MNGSRDRPRDAPARLTIGYSTLAPRSAMITLPPSRDDIEVVVVVQGGTSHGGHLDRDDVTLVIDDGVGAARSRNLVLDHATGDHVLFADDDSVAILDGVDQVLRVLDAAPDMSIAQGRAVDGAGRPRKRYPRRRTRLHRWNSAKIGTIELVVRRIDVIEAGVRFDDEFGAGTERYLGDEFIFVADALRAGLRGIFVPVDVAVHPAESSGSAASTDRDAFVRSSVFDRVYGRAAPLARLAFLVRRPLRFGSVGRGLRFVIGRRALEQPHGEADRPDGRDHGEDPGE